MAIDPKQPKPLHYALIIGERENTILAAMLEATMNSETGRYIFDRICNQEGVNQQDVAEFVKGWSDREHELGWCKSKTCKYQKTP